MSKWGGRLLYWQKIVLVSSGTSCSLEVFLLQVEAVCAKLLVDTDYVLGFVLCNLGSDIQLSLKYCINVGGGGMKDY